MFNRSMCYNSEKSLMVVSYVEGSYYSLNEGSL